MRIVFFFSLLSFTSAFCQDQVALQVYLIGNTADDNFVEQNILNQIDWQNENSAILFLGNDLNINFKSSKLSNLLKSYKGKTFYLPGNTKSIGEEETLVEEFFDRKDVFIPDDGCPGPEVKNLNKKSKTNCIE